MRSPSDGRQASTRGIAAALTAALALAACGAGPSAQLPLARLPANGPQADYPVVIGDPYTVAGVSYTPEDVLNYDEVGFAAADPEAAGASAAHHTLPLPSYVEITSLNTGRTILVRVERRGPMDGAALLALSPAALVQLDATTGTPIRVRRVNPPEEHRALLRAGESAPERMDTPMPLVEVLKRRLPAQGSAPLNRPEAEPQRAADLPALAAAPAPTRPPATGETAPPPALENGFVVQAAAFSTAERARRAAEALGGAVTQAGRYYRVRTGPFATRTEAEASLAKVRAAGYSDARILTSG